MLCVCCLCPTLPLPARLVPACALLLARPPGNICRSPTAEAMFRSVVEKAGLANQFEIDSCGTGQDHSSRCALRVLIWRSLTVKMFCSATACYPSLLHLWTWFGSRQGVNIPSVCLAHISSPAVAWAARHSLQSAVASATCTRSSTRQLYSAAGAIVCRMFASNSLHTVMVVACRRWQQQLVSAWRFQLP
jgi:hypothetical protein